ncbi:MAG: 6-pyruvoyl tetrahydrobiopterin synthase [Pirellulaceae bacterium]|nr:6-pyruvoyl tetrahydrobiopterin synthase [Pirellulaceae bacterium]
MRDFHIRIGGDGLGFHASHFIVWKNGACERLHGHGYRVSAEVHGPLDEDQCVFDFYVVRDALKKILADLDHRVLLPTKHPSVTVAERPGEVEVVHGDRRWVFPADDCLLLPIGNTTTELLAEYVGRRLRDALKSCGGTLPGLIRIEIGEGAGCSAVCELAE